MTNLLLIESSVKTVFLNCKKPENRHKILKSKLQRDQLDDDNEDVFQTGLADYYCLRPQGELWENMCINTFMSWYSLCNSSRHDNHRQPCFELQKLAKRIKQRSNPACIRMPKIGLHDNDEYFYSKLYCYLPFRSEMDLISPYENSHEAFFAKCETFDIAAYSRENIQNDLQKALHVIRCIENKDMDMTYSLTPNTAHYEEKFDNSENNYENKYKLLDDIGKTTNSVFFNRTNKILNMTMSVY